jgi:hypothetical protein
MSELSSFELEGSLNGQREVLTLILAHLLRGNDEALLQALDERLAPSNQQEDPGAVPHSAFAVEGARAREIKRIVDDAKARARSDDQV